MTQSCTNALRSGHVHHVVTGMERAQSPRMVLRPRRPFWISLALFLAGSVSAGTALAVGPVSYPAAKNIATMVGGGVGDGQAAGNAILDPRGMSVFAGTCQPTPATTYFADGRNNRVRLVRNGTTSVFAGTGAAGFSGDGGAAANAQLNFPNDVAADAAGNIYVADTGNNRIRRITPAGIITTVAGNGTSGFSGDGGSATSAALSMPYGLAVSAAGEIYVADFANHRIRRVANGIITTVAGTGQGGYSGDGGPGPQARLSYPAAVTLDANGNIYIADYLNNRVRRLSAAGTITTIAGSTGGFSGDGGPAVNAQLSFPFRLAMKRNGDLVIGDIGNKRVRVIAAANQVIRTVAGTGAEGGTGDEGPATQATLDPVAGITASSTDEIYLSSVVPQAGSTRNRIRRVDTAGAIHAAIGGGPGDGFDPRGLVIVAGGSCQAQAATLYVADGRNHRVRAVTNGVISTLAGTGVAGFGGDGGPAKNALLNLPFDVASDAAGNVYIVDNGNNRIRRVTPAGVISTIAGNGVPGATGDGGLATAATLYQPNGVAVGPTGDIYIADAGNNRVRKVTNGIITTVAGTGQWGFAGDGGPATQARLASPSHVALDVAGNLYIADSLNNRVRRVTPAGTITTIAGGPISGFAGDGGPAVNARLYFPFRLAFNRTGGLLISDIGNKRVRLVDAQTQQIRTVAGTGVDGGAGDEGPAIQATLDQTAGLAATSTDEVYLAGSVSDPRSTRNRIRRIDAAGIIHAAIGGGVGDGGDALNAFTQPRGSQIFVANGIPYLYFADSFLDGSQHRVRRVNLNTGVVETVAGTGVGGYSGDGGPATAARLSGPRDIALDASGTLYIADYGNNVVRRVAPNGTITTFAGRGVQGYGGDGGPATAATLAGPFGVAVDGSGNVFIAELVNNRVRRVATSGVITTVAGNGQFGFSGDGGAATAARISNPTDVVVASDGTLYIAELVNNRVRRVTPQGIISTFAGTVTAGSGGDGGPASQAQLNRPMQLALDNRGNLFIADVQNNKVRRVDAISNVITTVAGTGAAANTGDGGLATAASLLGPAGISLDASGQHLFISVSDRIRVVTAP